MLYRYFYTASEVGVARESGLRSADHLLAPAVAETLSNLELSGEDLALSRLAQTYAEQIDRAAGAAAGADRVLREIDQGEDPDLYEMVSALKAKLSERAAVSDLGPKLLAALDALGASPKARASAAKGGGSRGARGKLAAIRDSRAG